VIIPLKKLVAFNRNKYIFSRASMIVIDKVGNVQGFPDEEEGWKIVPNILKMMLDESIKYDVEYDE
jgi:hypothetical protein